MKAKKFGEIPGGEESLKDLLYPFYMLYPLKLWSKYRWFRNKNLALKLKKLNQLGRWVTVVNRLGARGDTLITANVIRCLKERYDNLKINCISPFPELIKYDPNINAINQPETFYSFDSTYIDLINRNDRNINVVEHNLHRLGIDTFEYSSNFHLTKSERLWAKKELSGINKPALAISTKSKEKVKNWPLKNWRNVLNEISNHYFVIHLGDDKEPTFSNVKSFAGKLSMRQTAAILSQCNLYIGPDSLLMHLANGVNLKAIIIFGDARPVKCLGYSDNINLTGTPSSNNHWLLDSQNSKISGNKNISNVSPEMLSCEINKLIKTNQNEFTVSI